MCFLELFLPHLRLNITASILTLPLLRVLTFHIAYLFLLELFHFSSHRWLFKLHSLTDLPIPKCPHIRMDLLKKLDVFLSFYDVSDDIIVDLLFVVFKGPFFCFKLNIAVARKELNEISEGMIDWKTDFFQKIKHERYQICLLNVSFCFPKLIESNECESPIKGDW